MIHKLLSPILFFAATAATMAAGILSVSPDSADPGDTVSVTMTLDGDAMPPVPPVNSPSGQPIEMSIGGIAGTLDMPARLGNNCTASFIIPGGQAPGSLECTVTFNTPNGDVVYSLVDGFTVNSNGEAVITQGPVSRNAALGGSVTFTVVATGDGTLAYQWGFDGEDIPGANADTYTIASVSLSDAGDYYCTVSNTLTPDGVKSEDATLSVYDLSEPLEHPYSIVDTGQKAYYDNSGLIAEPSAGDDFYGQDSSYLGNAPTYIASNDGLTVYDVHTGMTWTQTPDIDGNGTIDTDDKMTQAEAAAYVATLNAASFGGYNDWRLPSIKEIYSLMDFRGTDPTSDDISTLIPFIDTMYFDFGYGDTAANERVIDAQFATTSIYVDTVMTGQSAMFGLNLADGRIKGYPLTNGFYVLFCRGNTDYGDNDFVDNSDGTVTDQATGLMWQQTDSGTPMLWKDALAYAEASTHAGHSDWRLPNAKELHSLFDYSRSPSTTSSAAIDAIFSCTQITNEGGQADYPWYFTGTTHAQQGGGAEHAVYLCFGRATGYMNGLWLDVHGAGAQRSDPKTQDTSNYTYVSDGWYFTQSPQGDASRWSNYVRLVRDAPDTLPEVSLITVTQTVAFDSSSIVIEGTHNEHATSISWSNALTGGSGMVYLTGTSFSTMGIPLDMGDNVITITVANAQGDEASEQLTITRSSTFDGSVIYVDVDTEVAAAGQNGRAWASAFADLQDALAVVVDGQEIWVAEGVYYPDEAAAGYATVVEDDTSESFTLVEGVSIYGGFDGAETTRDEREWKSNVTILSGDLDQNDTTENDVVVTSPETNIIGTNSLSVVRGAGTYDALLDGVTITAGDGGVGGGIQGAGTFRRCVIQGNYGSEAGAAYCESHSDDEWYTFVGCDIFANTGNNIGGVSAYGIPNFTMTSCRVQGNQATGTATVSVGALHLGNDDSTLTNCVIAGNVGYHNGAIVVRNSGQVTIHNSTITANYATETTQADTTGGIEIESGASILMRNGILWGNVSAQENNFYARATPNIILSLFEGFNLGGEYDGSDPDNAPLFVDPITASATPSILGDYRLLGHSPGVEIGDISELIADISDLDDDGDISEDVPYDLLGNARVNGTLDLGPYELTDSEFVAVLGFDLEDGSVAFDVSSQTITGTHALVDGDIIWTHSPSGASGTATIDGDEFTITGVSLEFGLNQITLSADNYFGVMTEAVLSITRSSTFDGSVIYVDANTPAAAGDQNGRSWDTAFKHLQDALALVDGQDIWVANGTYYPDEAEAGYASVTDDDRYASFEISPNTGLYGGYQGYDASFPDTRSGTSVLSGDLDQDDTTAEGAVLSDPSQNTRNNNAYSVVSAGAIRTTEPTVLDGFVITAGRADLSSSDYSSSGGALYTNSAEGLSINDVSFIGNYALYYGGAVYCLGSGSVPFTNCAFGENEADQRGGAVYAHFTTPSFEDCYFESNSSQQGGTFYVNDADVVLQRCALKAGSAEDGGAVYLATSGSLKAYNSLFSGNSSSEGGAIETRGALTLEGCTLAGNIADGLGGGVHVQSGQVTIRNSVLAHNMSDGDVDTADASLYNFGVTVTITHSLVRGSGGSAAWDSGIGTDGGNNIDADPQYVDAASLDNRTSDGDYRLLARSPACDVGDNTYVLGSTDLAGDARIYNTTVDLGALEQSHGVSLPVLAVANGEAWVAAETAAISVEGTANGSVVGDISWSNDLTGGSGTFAASSTWTLGDVAFAEGTNTLTFIGENSLGTDAIVTVTIVGVGDVLFVDVNSPVAALDQDGLTWKTAFADPQDAFDAMSFGEAVWIAEGTYIPATGTSFELNFEDGAVYGGFESGMDSADSRNHELYPVVFDGDGESRLIVSMNAEAMILDGVEISNAVATSGVTTAGMLVGDGIEVLQLKNCTFTGFSTSGNMTTEGLAMKIVGQGTDGFVTIEDCTFADNTTGLDGGADGIGLYAKDIKSLTLTNTTFDNNTKGSRYGEIYGAAAYFGSIDTISIIGCDFTNNGGDPYQGLGRGGAVSFEGATDATVEDCRFEGNTFESSQASSTTGGAAVSVYSVNAEVAFERCQFIGNTFTTEANARGGALHAYNGLVTVTNCLFRDNVADRGGAVYFRGGDHVVRNSTIVENTATTSGGGVYLDGVGEVHNSIVYDNVSSGTANVAVVESGSVTYSCTNTLMGGEGNITGNPFFVDAANDDFQIDLGSVCINAGANALWMNGEVDLNGDSRVFAQRVDMGAYEASGAGISDADTDGDDLGDWDELVIYGSDSEKADSDGDGMDDGGELIAGTDMTDGTSVLSLSVAVAAEGGFELQWPSVDGRLYTLRGTDDLTEPAEDWDDLGDFSATSPLNLTEVTPAGSTYFFRLEVQEDFRGEM